MRITKISVKGLFGMFDHEIPLNQESRITIIHGPNGVGKTVLLRMVHGLFNHDYEPFTTMHFEQFRVELEGEDCITVQFGDGDDYLSIERDNGTIAEFAPYVPEDNFDEVVDSLRPLDLLRRKFTEEPAWISLRRLSVYLSREEVLNDFPELHKRIHGEIPPWFSEISHAISTEFYGTRRLQSDTAPREADLWKGITKQVFTIGFFQSENKDIQLFLRNLKNANSRERIEVAIMFILVLPFALPLSIVQGILRLVYGPFDGLFFRLMQQIQDRNAVIEARLEFAIELASEDSYARLRLFEEIVNRRFLFASLKFNEDAAYSKDYRLFARDGGEIPEDRLSSGEKHLLALYYHLVFVAQPGSLIFIDEPELSLHVDWQEHFLRDIQRIVELRNIDLLIATHSPTLIDDKWEWTVGLGYPESEIMG